jgi:8-oxo-dGTP pyrophosphatase MutT (NUDIX family)
MKTKVVVGAIIRKGDSILLGKKTNGTTLWYIPGGGIRLGQETTNDAVLREIMEETGLVVKNLEKAAWDTEMKVSNSLKYNIFLQYVCDYDKGDLKPGDDMCHLCWVSIDELSGYSLTRPARLLLEKTGYL